MANEWRRYCAKITNVWILKKVSWNYWFISSLRCYDVPLQTQQSLYNLHSAQCTIVAPNHCYMINSGQFRASDAMHVTDATTKCNMLQSSKRCGCNKCICLNFNGKCKCPFVMYFFLRLLWCFQHLAVTPQFVHILNPNFNMFRWRPSNHCEIENGTILDNWNQQPYHRWR